MDTGAGDGRTGRRQTVPKGEPAPNKGQTPWARPTHQEDDLRKGDGRCANRLHLPKWGIPEASATGHNGCNGRGTAINPL